MTSARIGAFFFLLWGLLHIVGGGAILAALGDGPAAGYAMYEKASGNYPPAAGGILGYAAFSIFWTGLLVTIVAVAMNWRNRPLGAWVNIALAGGADIGLVLYLMIPGYVALSSGMMGISLFVLGAGFSLAGLAARNRT